MQEHAETGQQQVGKIRDQMAGRFSFDREWKVAPPNPRQQFLAGLNGAFGPAVLLRLETIHVHRQFRRRHDVGKKNKFPSHQLRAITQIEIFTERVVLPAAGLLYTCAPPKTGRSVEVKKTSTSAARRLFQQKMAVQKHGLHPREQRVTAIQMAPATLNHADFRIGEKMDRALEQIWRRDKIGVQNADEFPCSRFKSGRERTCLETGPVDPVNELNIETALPQFIGARSGHFPCVISGIVQHLDLEQLARVIELADRAQKAFHHVNFIKNRKLNRDLWQLPKPAGWNGRAFAVLQEKINDEIPVNAVGRETNEHGEVTRRPNHIAEASLHKVGCQLLRQQVRMMALPSPASNQKWRTCLDKTASTRAKIRTMSARNWKRWCSTASALLLCYLCQPAVCHSDIF